MLRPRYRPGWVPEALVKGKKPWESSVLERLAGPGGLLSVLDATRISNGGQVVLKIVDRGSTEVHILELLNKHSETANPTVPVLDTFPMPDDAERLFIVMPRMRELPSFKTVHEFAEFLRQLLEVWYPDFDSRVLVVGGEAETLKRVELHGGHLIPKISDTVSYDPFKIDVRLVGEMWYAGLDFVMPLVSKLLHDDPTQRPTAAGALKMFERLVHDVHGTQLDKPTMIHHYSSRSR
ncbi:hypothetical protein B0H16DRAFT_1463454 [Mycena metata]|uniref:Protein kinase domain-containing protein n=1 Tax=Mycena metata TaxID=1033252 RepID=A0AAD7IKR0_9AGAR|nr:hypothetical protein B0H16DRAFT_1463454 [Mycena metata]